jgi:prepilin-type N-terminal cleavage/methylation domain-containing protein
VSGTLKRYARSQDGYTLIEVVIASAIGAILMGALFSVVFTSVRAVTTATSRVEASQQIRSFQLLAYDDFAHSGPPYPNGCSGTVASPCSTQPINLSGLRASNSTTPVIALYSVSYVWNSSSQFLERQVAGNPANHAAIDVGGFSWYLDGTAPNQAVVVVMTVTIPPSFGEGTYSETQTLRFYPEVNP